jgi:hypothetical protein
MKKELQTLIKQMEEIAGEWNGDEAGRQEERAHIAEDITEKAKELIDLLEELDEL